MARLSVLSVAVKIPRVLDASSLVLTHPAAVGGFVGRHSAVVDVSQSAKDLLMEGNYINYELSGILKTIPVIYSCLGKSRASITSSVQALVQVKVQLLLELSLSIGSL